MKARIITVPKRRRPKVGDMKMIRGVLHMRRWSRATYGAERGALIVSNGRPVYEWVPA